MNEKSMSEFLTKIKQMEAENAQQAEVIKTLAANMTELRDLVRTGLPPICYDEHAWNQHKLYQVEGFLARALDVLKDVTK